jgi:arsenate reductase
MISNIKIYGIKNCDTVKKALKYLSSNEIDFDFIDFRVNPISKNEFQNMIEKVGLEVLINKRSTTYRLLTDSEKDNVNFELILKYPTLIKRPVMIQDSKILVGFSEQKYLDFLR